ncbi:MAG: hypothetical protein GY839_18280 [candidate division Zixibacteria bacterium]|nr:hypothetical protein [candidate division Zixibacteria bacterium]
MNFKTLMIIKAVVCLGFGPVLLLFPEQLLNLLGLTFCVGAAFTAREYGAALIGNLMLTWFARGVEASVARRAIILHLFVYDAIALVVTLIFVLTGRPAPLGWGIVVVYLFFTIGYGYFLLPQRKTA